jgi:hypothetical protein
MPEHKGKSYPLRRGMIVRYKKSIVTKKNGKYFNGGHTFVTGTIVNESYNDNMQHIFKIKDEKEKHHFVKASHLYQTAEIVSLGTYTYWDDLKENHAVIRSKKS